MTQVIERPAEIGTRSADLLPLVTPGEILREEFMEPYGITPYRLAKDIGVSQTRVEQILDGKRAITADTAARFSRYFGTSLRLWLNLQQDFDLRKFEREADLTRYESISLNLVYAEALRGA